MTSLSFLPGQMKVLRVCHLLEALHLTVTCPSPLWSAPLWLLLVSPGCGGSGGGCGCKAEEERWRVRESHGTSQE